MTAPPVPDSPAGLTTAARPGPLPDAWLAVLLAWDHDRRAPITWHHGVPGTDALPAVLMAAARTLGARSPFEVTAAEVLEAAEAAELPAALRDRLRPALAAFSAWACPRGLLDGDPYTLPPTPDHTPGTPDRN